MLPSSPSQLARYGHINHYKKFWLLQTQLEKQEQSSAPASASLNVQGSPATLAAGHTSFMKESSIKSSSSSLVAHHGSGEYHAHMASQLAICRMEASTAGSSTAASGGSRIISGIPSTLSVHSSAGLDTAYANICSFIDSRAPHNANSQRNMNLLRDVNDRPRLSLAVYYENIPGSASKSTAGPSKSSSSLSHSLVSTRGSGADDGDNGGSSFTNEGERSLRLSYTYQSPPRPLGPGDQLHAASEFCTSVPPKALPSLVGVNPRTCTLCGTSRTPLWRSGPNGPKSLCNACGIRVKKTKRLEAALQVARGSSPAMAQFKAVKKKHSSDLLKEAALQKKKRLSDGPRMAKQEVAAHGKIVGRSWAVDTTRLAHLRAENVKRCATALAEDVEEAAVLLMALSCGLVLS